MNNKELLGLIEDVKNVCINMATGGDFDYEKYENARQKILSEPELKSALPDWLIENRYGSQYWTFIKTKFAHYGERRNFLRMTFDELTELVNNGGAQPTASSIRISLDKIDRYQVKQLWKKSLERLQHDPDGAITSSKSLLESTLKYILDMEQISYSNKDDLIDLYKKVKKVLNLDPSNHNIETFKQILNGVTSVVGGFSSLRNEYGDAHGKGNSSYMVENRHAELAINLSGALCSFLINTYKKESQK